MRVKKRIQINGKGYKYTPSGCDGMKSADIASPSITGKRGKWRNVQHEHIFSHFLKTGGYWLLPHSQNLSE